MLLGTAKTGKIFKKKNKIQETIFEENSSMVNLTSNSFNGLFQVLFYLGLLLIGYGLLQGNEAKKLYKQQGLAYHIAVDSLNVEFKADTTKANYELKEFNRLKAEVGELNTTRLGKKLEQQEIYTKQIELDMDSMNIISQHAYEHIWQSIREAGFIKALRDRTENAEEDLKTEREYSILFVILGFILFAGSGWVLNRNENRTNNITLIEQYKKGKVWLWCQSCGRNFSAKRPHGTEIDKSKNFGYCLECYKEGQFTNPNLTREEVKATFDAIIKIAKKKDKKHFQKRFESLDRWQQSEYRRIDIESYLGV